MTSPYTPYGTTPASFTPLQISTTDVGGPSAPSTPTPTRGRPRGALTGTGAKRGRKPRGGGPLATASPRPFTPAESTTATPTTAATFPSTQFSHLNWAMPTGAAGTSTAATTSTTTTASATTGTAPPPITVSSVTGSTTTLTPALQQQLQALTSQMQASQAAAQAGQTGTTTTGTTSTTTTTLPTTLSSLANLSSTIDLSKYALPAGSTLPSLNTSGLLTMSGGTLPPSLTSALASRATGGGEDGDGDDELLPAMADEDYSAHSTWQSQSKDNMKVLMDNLSPAQYDRFEAYRRHALPKQAVRKVIQQTLGQQVSQPVAQIVAGFAKVFVGEIVEKARAVQERRGETGPLSPDHLREAYRMYQAETGRVGAARPLRSKKLFVR